MSRVHVPPSGREPIDREKDLERKGPCPNLVCLNVINLLQLIILGESLALDPNVKPLE